MLDVAMLEQCLMLQFLMLAVLEHCDFNIATSSIAPVFKSMLHRTKQQSACTTSGSDEPYYQHALLCTDIDVFPRVRVLL